MVGRGGAQSRRGDGSVAGKEADGREGPYRAAVAGAKEPAPGEKRGGIGGRSCLAGDYMGEWACDREQKVGDRLVFEDMIHDTMVKTTMFNGVDHPSIAIRRQDGTLEIVREFGYEDYRNRMSSSFSIDPGGYITTDDLKDFTPTRYKLLNVATGRIFADRGWTLDDPKGG